MANSSVPLDLTLSDLEDQNPYKTNFSTQPAQNQVWQWQILMNVFHI